jgi:hypothetical protein
MPKKDKSTLSSYHDRDMDKEPWTISELAKILSDFPQDYELRFVGFQGEIFFHRFKQRGEKLMTIEFDDPNYIEDNEAWNAKVRKLERKLREHRDK